MTWSETASCRDSCGMQWWLFCPHCCVTTIPHDYIALYLFIVLRTDTWLSFQCWDFMNSATVSMSAHLFGGQMASFLLEWRCWVTGKAHGQLREKTPHGFPRVCPHPRSASTCIHPTADDGNCLSSVYLPLEII